MAPQARCHGHYNFCNKAMMLYLLCTASFYDFMLCILTLFHATLRGCSCNSLAFSIRIFLTHPLVQVLRRIGDLVLFCRNRFTSLQPRRHNASPDLGRQSIILQVLPLLEWLTRPNLRTSSMDADAEDGRAGHLGFGRWNSGVLPPSVYE